MNFISSKNMITKIFLSLFSSLLFILSFPDFNLSIFAWFCLIPLFFSVKGEKPLSSFYIAWFSAFAAFSGTIYWVTNSMYYYGGIPLYLSFFFLFLLSAYLALYVGCFFMIYSIVEKKFSQQAALTVSPFLWVTLEYLRGHLLTGFPWALLGYSQWRMLKLIQFSDITGIYGISFLIVLFNVALFFLLSSREMKLHILKRFSFLSISILILIIVLIYGNVRIGEVKKILSNRDSFSIGVVQGNIEQDLKWDEEKILSNLYKHFSLTESLISNCSPEMVLWSETALPFFPERKKEYTEMVEDFVKRKNIVLLSGALGVDEFSGNEKIYNSVFLFTANRGIAGRYDKIHLVPFGEYIPLENLLRITAFDKIIGTIGSFDEGSETKVFEYKDKKFSIIICYEIIFPDLVRRFVKAGAQFILNVTNDAWFGETSAPQQHFSNGVFRAIENRRFLIRSANTGISGVISPVGEIIKKTDIFKEDIFCYPISEIRIKTFYSTYGDVFAFCCIIFSLLFMLFILFQRGKN